jgi:aminopeptidase N
LENKYGSKKLAERMAMERKKVIRFNRFSSKPVVYDEKQNLFNLLNPNSYEKGAWVLHLLRRKIGDEKFFTILRNFYKTYQNKNASTTDFIEMSENISGKNLQLFFNQWLFRAGLPELSVKYQSDKASRKITVMVKQYGEVYDLKLPVAIISGEKQMLKRLHLTQKEQSFTIKLPKTFFKSPIKIKVDPNVDVLFKLSK